MTSFIFETIIEFSAAFRNVNAQLLLMNRGLSSSYIMIIWILLWDPLTYLFHWGTRVLVIIIIKVSGATARWPFTDSAVPSLLLLFLFLLLLFFTHQLLEAAIRPTELKFAQDVSLLNSKNGFSNFCDSTSGSGNIRIIREIAYTAISLQPMIQLEWKLVLSKEESKASFLNDIRKDEQLPVPVVFVQYKMDQKRYIRNFRKYRPIFFKFTIQLLNWKRWKNN